MRIHNYFRCCVVTLILIAEAAAAEHRGLVKFGGLPLPGASVTATQGEKTLGAITDAQGAYSFADLAEGVWKMRVEMLCFEPVEQDVTVKTGEPGPQWELKLLPFETIKASAPPPPPPPPVSTTLVTQTATPPPAQKKNSRERAPA